MLTRSIETESLNRHQAIGATPSLQIKRRKSERLYASLYRVVGRGLLSRIQVMLGDNFPPSAAVTNAAVCTSSTVRVQQPGI
jgi:hypothetical protein